MLDKIPRYDNKLNTSLQDDQRCAIFVTLAVSKDIFVSVVW